MWMPVSRFAVALGLAACGSTGSLAWVREKSFEKDFALDAAVEDCCAKYCEKATDHDRSKCGDATCDRHEHRVGAWNLSPFDVAAALEAWGKEFADEVEPQAPAPVRGTSPKPSASRRHRSPANFEAPRFRPSRCRSAAPRPPATPRSRSDGPALSPRNCTSRSRFASRARPKLRSSAPKCARTRPPWARRADVTMTPVKKGDCPCAPK